MTRDTIRQLLADGRAIDAALLFGSLPDADAQAELRDAVLAGCIAVMTAAEQRGDFTDADDAASAAAGLLPAERLPDLWRRQAIAMVSGADPARMIEPAVAAFLAEPLDIWSTVLLMEAAEHIGAVTLARAVARVLRPLAISDAISARSAALADRSAVGTIVIGDAQTLARTSLGISHLWQVAATPIAPLEFTKRVRAVALTPCDAEALIALVLTFIAPIMRADIALALAEQLEEALPGNPAAAFALDRIAARIGDPVAVMAKRARTLTAALQSLAPPTPVGTDTPWDYSADTPTGTLIDSIRTRGFVAIRQAVPASAITAAAAIVFPNGPAGPWQPPAEMPTGLLLQLIAPGIAAVLASLGLTQLDAATSHSRAIVPGPDMVVDAMTTALHQDSMLFGQPLINLWLPFDRCGMAAPSLALVPDADRALLPTQVTGGPQSDLDAGVMDQAIANQHIQRFGLVTVTMEPGDALLFLGSVPHQTHYHPAMTDPRRSIELRFVPAAYAIQPVVAVVAQ